MSNPHTDVDIAKTLQAKNPMAVAQPIALADISSRDKNQNGAGWKDDGTMYTLDTTGLQGVAQFMQVRRLDVVTVNIYGGNKRTDRPQGGFYVRTDENTSKTLDAASGLNPICSQGGTAVMQSMQVRRLTPRECERLQGFPDDYTLIPYRNKPAADGPRYRALGNSMAVPVMKWIGKRINAVQEI